MSDDHSAERLAPQSAPSNANSELTKADNQFFLGLYRCAVSEYQPKIEKRTGVSLGPIAVRNFQEIDEYVVRDLKRGQSWMSRWFFKARNKSRRKQWREYLQSTHHDRAGACMASYYGSAIYVSFSNGTETHEYGIAFAVVHELSHALWERLAGCSLYPPPSGTPSDLEKFQLLVEGFATYAERVWFSDVYPSSVRKFANDPRAKPLGVYFQGMKRVEELVEQYGAQILFEIPKRWREF